MLNKSYGHVAFVVKKEYGNAGLFNEATTMIEAATYKIGFTAAMQLIGECDTLLSETWHSSPSGVFQK